MGPEKASLILKTIVIYNKRIRGVKYIFFFKLINLVIIFIRNVITRNF